MSDIAALLERVRAATGPDRYADCHLWVIAQGGDARMHVCDSSTQDFIWERGIDGFWVRDVVKFRAVPRYTASVDAALALVERATPDSGPNMVYSFDLNWHASAHAEMSYTAELYVAEGNPPDMTSYQGQAPTLPLAIIAALLTALKDSNHE